MLMLFLATLLVSAQATWAAAVKGRQLTDSGIVPFLVSLLTDYRIWIGVVLYVCATATYFILLSQHKFFMVQVSMTALVIVFSTLLAGVVFHESITALNVIGIILVLAGLVLVTTS